MKISTSSIRRPAFTAASLLAGAVMVTAADWTQYRGSVGDGISTERIAAKWPAAGPKQVWKTPATDGFSSYVLAGGKGYTLVSRAIEGVPREVCVAIEAGTGKELWAAPIGVPRYGHDGGNSGAPDNSGGDGPRSTPAVDGNRVYAFSADLGLYCLDAKDGKVIWSKDLMKEHAGRNITWKNAASPLLDGKLIFVAGGGPGESLLGIDKADGKVVWKGEDEKMTHATPTVATILGTRQVIFFTQSGLVSVQPADGKVLWRHPFRYNVSTAASPVVGGDIVYCAAGYGVGATAVRIAKTGAGFAATELWRKTGDQPVANHWSTPVYKDGHLYGMFSFKKYATGPLKCVELATGEVKWEKPGFGAGNVILTPAGVLALADNGELALVEASPAAYNEIARVKAVAGKCWSTPSLSNGKVYIRSTKEGACFDLTGAMAQQ